MATVDAYVPINMLTGYDFSILNDYGSLLRTVRLTGSNIDVLRWELLTLFGATALHMTTTTDANRLGHSDRLSKPWTLMATCMGGVL